MSNQLTKTASNPKELGAFLDSLKGQMELALPEHMNADRMCRLALTAFSTTPKLRECTMQSIAACVMMSSQLGLEIGVNGQAYMIPYGTTATFVPGWKGLIDLVNRSARSSVWTGAVFEGDFFEWELGSNPKVVHRPAGESDPAMLEYVYAVGRNNGSDYPVIEVWPNDRVKKHFAKFNKVGARHYAHQNWEMYARKVVLLQVLKYLPQSVELSIAIEADHKATATTIEGVAKNITTLDGLTERITEQADGETDTVTTDELPPEIIATEQAVNDIQAATDTDQISAAIGMAEQTFSELKLTKAKAKPLTDEILDAAKAKTEELEG